jgi:DNA-binding NtrC family response regulator
MARIIVVDSDSVSNGRLARLLAADDHEVRLYERGDQALEDAISSATEPQLMILAWDLGGLVGGPELLTRLRQRQVTFPQIVINSLVNLQIRNRVVGLGAQDLLSKPIDGDRLRLSVGRALQDPLVVDPLVAELRREIVGESPALVDAVLMLAKAIHSCSPSLLLIGESGVGKEIFAQLFHRHTCRSGAPIEAVNLAGLSSGLIESELFGHEKGAFTNASHQHQGVFERAGEGTLFLDEIGYLDSALQPKLLRAIDQREFVRVGGTARIPFQARLVCATSRNLAESVKNGSFRPDLYYRISQFEIRIPPLRKRQEDLRPLMDYFLAGTGVQLERETLEILKSYSFPGNVRELRDILQYARDTCHGQRVLPGDLPGEIMEDRESTTERPDTDWKERFLAMSREEALRQIEIEFDREYLPRMLAAAGGNKEEAARRIGITAKTLRQKLRNCGLYDFVRQEEGDES